MLYHDSSTNKNLSFFSLVKSAKPCCAVLSEFVTAHTVCVKFEHFHQRVIFSSKFLVARKLSNISQEKREDYRKVSKKRIQNVCRITMFFLCFCTINHLMTPPTYLMTPWSDPQVTLSFRVELFSGTLFFSSVLFRICLQ